MKVDGPRFDMPDLPEKPAWMQARDQANLAMGVTGKGTGRKTMKGPVKRSEVERRRRRRRGTVRQQPRDEQGRFASFFTPIFDGIERGANRLRNDARKIHRGFKRVRRALKPRRTIVNVKGAARKRKKSSSRHTNQAQVYPWVKR
ncbi:MAG: hypothetical protein J2P36_27715 [Ktedonobacteraceae bacterium]|nr:hypothetical protein [Ktedonobacteraceae bacterium]